MREGRSWRRLLRVGRAEVEADVRTEVETHLELQVADLVREGWTAEDARAEARRRFGERGEVEREMVTISRLRERDRQRAQRWETVFDDVRYAARTLLRTKGLTAIAIVSLAVGIGASAAMFSLVNATLLRPRGVSQAEQLVELYVGDRNSPYETTSYPSYAELRERNGVLTGLAAYGIGWQFNLGLADDVEQVWGEAVSGNYFDVLGVRPHLGRTFLPEEDQVPGRNPVAVIGYGLWQRRFDSDPSIVGRTVTINRQPLTVIGIAPPNYRGMVAGWASEVWIPLMTTPIVDPVLGERRLTRDSRWLTMIGRLERGTTIEQARSRFDMLTREMQSAHPEEWLDGGNGTVRELFISVLPERATRVHPAMRAPVYALALLLLAIVDLVLVIACINLAGMFLARAIARRSEIAVRLALGAGRSRIVRQLLTESVVLSLVAGAIGALLAVWALAGVMTRLPALPEGVRIAVDIHPDWRVVVYTLVFSSFTGVLFGLAPALQASRGALSAVLKDAATVTERFRRSRARQSLIVAQLALSLLLLIAAGLVVRSLENVRPTRLGFASENYLVAPLSLDEAAYDRRSGQQFFMQLAAGIAELPGVRTVSLVEGMPGGLLSRSRRSTGIEGYTPADGESLEIDAAIVGPSYFTNLGVPIVAGRDFDERDRDGAPCVAIINEVFARRYLGGAGPALGRHLIRREEMCRIVGIVRDEAWQSLAGEVRPFHALPLLQSDHGDMTLVVETAGDPAALTPAVRQVIRRLDPHMPATAVRTLGDHFDATLYPFRIVGLLMAGCALMALLLAIMGIYGMVSWSVAQRRREVGIRIAFGAAHRDVLALVVRQGMLPVGLGLGIGLLLAVALARVLASLPVNTELMFGVGATDPLTFAGVTLLLALVALVACLVPALRAAQLDPMVTLRSS
jgi:predicted permease